MCPFLHTPQNGIYDAPDWKANEEYQEDVAVANIGSPQEMTERAKFVMEITITQPELVDAEGAARDPINFDLALFRTQGKGLQTYVIELFCHRLGFGVPIMTLFYTLFGKSHHKIKYQFFFCHLFAPAVR